MPSIIPAIIETLPLIYLIMIHWQLLKLREELKERGLK